MAGLAAAWRLSEPGWRDVLERSPSTSADGASAARAPAAAGRTAASKSTACTSGWATTRTPSASCASLRRARPPRTDPAAPIPTWREAMIPTGEGRARGSPRRRLAPLARRSSAERPVAGEPDTAGHELTVADSLRRALRLIADFLESLPDDGAMSMTASSDAPAARDRGLRVTVLAAGSRPRRRCGARSTASASRRRSPRSTVRSLRSATRSSGWSTPIRPPAHVVPRRGHDRRAAGCWPTASSSATAASARSTTTTSSTGSRVTAPRPRSPTSRSSVGCTTSCSPTPARASSRGVRAGRGRVPAHRRCSSSTAARSSGRWPRAWATSSSPRCTRRCAGGACGSSSSTASTARTCPATARASSGAHRPPVARRRRAATYEPLVRVGGLPGFPSPAVDQLDAPAGIADAPLESHFCDWPDAETRVSRHGRDFDVLVLAISIGMAPVVCARADRGPARVAGDGRAHHDDRDAGLPALAARGRAVARLARARTRPSAPTRALQHVGLDAPADRRRGVARRRPAGHDRLLLRRAAGRLAARRPGQSTSPASGRACARTPSTSSSTGSPTCCRARRPTGRSAGSCCAVATGTTAAARSTPSSASPTPTPPTATCSARRGATRYRLRADESGYDNLFLAGDWTDSGLNAGCIEAAVLSGLQAANAVAGRSREPPDRPHLA